MIKKILLFLTIAIILSGCTKTAPEKAKQEDNEQYVTENDQAGEENVVEAPEPEVKDPKEVIDLSLKPNESGKIMVLMYHNIGEEEKEWVRTPDNFRKDLLTLYEKGYRPISLKDYVSGNITTPEGFTPIVLTFDDGNKNNFDYLDDNKMNKDSMVGILVDFNKEYPAFSPAATFFLNDVPFGQKEVIEEKLKFLLDNGMDIGNHTRTHANFTKISKEDLQKEIGSQAQYLKELIKDQSYTIDTMALPFGSRPKDESLKVLLKEGTYNDIVYNNVAILNVGWNPAFSPYDTRFDFESIPRIRASEMKVDNVGMYNYIEYFDNHPDERFISDGFPEIITVPKEKADLVSPDSGKEIYLYDK